MYRPEYPDPQFERKNWENLNGEWQFEIDNGESGDRRTERAAEIGFYKRQFIKSDLMYVL